MTSLLLSLLAALSLTACGNDELTDAPGNVSSFDESTPPFYSSYYDPSSAASDSDPGDKSFYAPEAENDYIYTEVPGETAPPVEEGAYYYDLESVMLYLEYYGELPDNYITKDEARALGWNGGSPERYLEGAAIGGDRFYNRDGQLPKADGRLYTECDLNTDGKDSRGPERLVFSNDGLYFHTEDHYGTFVEYYVTEDWEVLEW